MAARYGLLILIALFTSSCYYNKKLVYLQDHDVSTKSPKVVSNTKVEYRVQPNDVLSVRIKSATNADVSDIFNISGSQSALYTVPGSLYIEGYSVNENGTISLPVIGDLKVSDLTVDEIRSKIQQEAQRYLKSATVIVKLVSFKVIVLGEVNNPGYHYVYNNQATVLEGIGLAGDLTRLGNRKNVKLIRQKNNRSEIILLDLTDAKLLQSPYFFLMPNDVIYVEPLKASSKRSNLELLGVLFSAATTTILILNYVDSN